MNQNQLKNIPQPFSSHRVTLKSIHQGLCAPSPSKALEYIMTVFDDTAIIVNKQKVRSITVTINFGDNIYNIMKLNFVKDMGRDFIWKD